MEILLYFGKVILTSGVMFLYYRLFLKDKTFHHYNRFYLLAATLISFILPLLKVSYFTLEINNKMILLISRLNNFQTAKNTDYDFFYTSVIVFISGLVAVFFLGKLIFGLAKIQILKKKFTKENFEGISFYQTNLENAPFSFFKNLFWKNSILIQSDLGRQILKHEMVHIEQKHSWDKIFLEITTSLFWFNPFFYLIKKEINLIHEYLADNKALKNSDTKAFAQMLLASHFSGKQFPATSPFLSSNLKKRLTMLKKSKTKFSYARKIFALPILFSLTFIYMVNAKNKEIKETNLEIENLVSNIKSDTITPKINEQNTLNEKTLQDVQMQIGEKQKEIEPLQKSLNEKSEEARKLSEQLRMKSDQMSKFKTQKDFESPQFKTLDLEINQLGAKVDEIYSKDDYKKLEKKLNEKYGEIDQLYVKIDKYYNSEDFKNQIKEAEQSGKAAEKLANSPKFIKMIRNAEKEGKKAEKLVKSPAFKKQIADAEKQAEDAVKFVNSAEFQQNIKDAETAAKDSKAAMRDSQVSLNDSKNTSVILSSNAAIFIDGKPATDEEMKRLDPNKIESMNINKKGFNGNKKSEIHIKLKK